MKKIIPTIKSLALGIVIALVASYASANTWVNPPGSPPSSNTNTPINVSLTDQVKGSYQDSSGLIVGAFSAGQNAQFEQSAYFNGIIRADSPDNLAPQSLLKFGGTDPLGVNRIVDLLIKGKIASTKSITASNLANATMSEVCADTAGNLVLCGTTPPPAGPVCTIISFTANPSTITGSGNSTLLWATTNCTTATIDTASVATNGSASYSITQAKTFTLVAQNTTSSDSKTVTVSFVPPADQCSNISGMQDVVPSGYTRQSDGSCKIVINIALTNIEPYFGDIENLNRGNKLAPYVVTFTIADGSPAPFNFNWGYCWLNSVSTTGGTSTYSLLNYTEPHCIRNDSPSTNLPYINWGYSGAQYWPYSTGNNNSSNGVGMSQSGPSVYQTNGYSSKSFGLGMINHSSVVSGSRGNGPETVKEGFTSSNSPFGSITKVYISQFSLGNNGSYIHPSTGQLIYWTDVILIPSSSIPGVELIKVE